VTVTALPLSEALTELMVLPLPFATAVKQNGMLRGALPAKWHRFYHNPDR